MFAELYHGCINLYAIFHKWVGQNLLGAPLPSYVQSFHHIDDVLLGDIFVTYCYLYKRSPQIYFCTVSEGQESRHGLPGLCSESHKATIKVLFRLHSHLEA